MTLNLKKKIIGIATISTVLPVLIILGLLFFQKASLTKSIVNEVDSLARNTLSQTTLGIYNQCKLANEFIQYRLNHNIAIGEGLIRQNGSIGKSIETVQWEPINQETKTVGNIVIPKFLIGGKWFGKNKDVNTVTPLVDELAKLGESSVTIFQRMDNEGDMLRVATTIVNKDGERAIGTYIPVKNADGENNKIIATVLKGNTYYGNAFVVDKYYQSVYKPLKDGSGNIIGMLYVGISPEKLFTLRKSIMDLVIGKTGYVYVIYGAGIRKGYYVISKGGKRDGENIWQSKDAGGRYFIQDVVNHSVAMDEGKIIYEYYPWKNKDDKIAKLKIAGLMYYKPFDWIIGASTFEDEFRSAEAVVKSGISNLMLWTSLLSMIVIAIMITISIFLGSKIATPIINASKIMTIIAEGRLNEAQSEIERLNL